MLRHFISNGEKATIFGTSNSSFRQCCNQQRSFNTERRLKQFLFTDTLCDGLEMLSANEVAIYANDTGRCIYHYKSTIPQETKNYYFEKVGKELYFSKLCYVQNLTSFKPKSHYKNLYKKFERSKYLHAHTRTHARTHENTHKHTHTDQNDIFKKFKRSKDLYYHHLTDF